MTQMQLPYLAAIANYPPEQILRLVPYELACRYRCVPIGKERSVITLATEQRLQQVVVLELEALTQHTIFQVRCGESVLDDLLQHWQQQDPEASGT